MSHTRHCPACGKEWHNVPSHIVEMYHRCPEGHRLGSIRPARIRSLPDTEQARSALFAALLEAQGPDSIWRPLGDDR